MSFDKTICRLWGHKFSLNTANLYPIDGGSEVICIRCGKEHFQPSLFDRPSDLTESLPKREFMYKRQQDIHLDLR